MIITKLKEKYKCGCGRGVILEKPELLSKIKQIIEWDFSKLVDENDTKSLEPGDCFMIAESDSNIQVLAINSKDTITLTISGTGPKSLERIWTDKIEAELDILSWNDIDPEAEIEISDKESEITEGMESYSIPYKEYRLWLSKYKPGYAKDSWEKDTILLKTLFAYPNDYMELIIDAFGNLWYKPEQLAESDMTPRLLWQLVVNTYYTKIPRVMIVEEEKKGEEKNEVETV